jgi:uncharacterized protein (DUF1800 family)
MKAIVLLATLFTTLAAHAAAIGYEGARHLLNRAGFGATEGEVEASAGLSREEAVDRIIRGARTTAVTAPPVFVGEPFSPYYKLREMSEADRMAEQKRNIERSLELREWWYREMLSTPSPLTEKMTLFWHNHFATSQQKVRNPQLVYRQNALLRSEALGNFGVLLHAIARDPAMLVYLDNAGSRKEKPNENFAREVMELFTLGEGSYTEKDIKEAARAFTGLSLDRDSGEFRYRPFIHDDGEKLVFGSRGRYGAEDVLDLLLARPETASFITRKLWREFVSPVPDEQEVKVLAEVFRDSRYDTRALLRAMLLADAFWAPENRASLIKSPVDLVVGTLHTFEIRPIDLRPAVLAGALLGQNVFSPPNVKGWPGGEAWINSATLLGRKQVLDRLFRAEEMAAAPAMMAASAAAGEQFSAGKGDGREARMQRRMDRGMGSYAFNWDKWARPFGAAPAQAARIERLVLAAPPVTPAPDNAAGLELVRALVSDPVYQLK